MINARLTTAEAAERLGVKPTTLYAYVSRGLLSRERSTAGSTFDAHEVGRLARTSRHGNHPGGVPDGSSDVRRAARDRDEPIFVTELTLIRDGRLFYRGLDAIELSKDRSLEEVASWLWWAGWPEQPSHWRTPERAGEAVAQAVGSVRPDCLPIERFMLAVAAAALTDDLRHDLSPPAVSIMGEGLISTLVDALPLATDRSSLSVSDSIAERLWGRLSVLELTEPRRRVLESALVLSADHELAPSTMAARVAAAFRADPYAVVSTGLGPASGSWFAGSSGAPGEVEMLLGEAEVTDAQRAIGERLRRTGSTVHGFGMPLYPDGDPRGAALLSSLDDIEGSPSRHALVERIVQIGDARGFAAPNIDLALGALAFCGEMIPGAGQAIATLGKVVGWLAHAMEEYADPTRFRSRAAYVGTLP
jgi:citrate synthase